MSDIAFINRFLLGGIVILFGLDVSSVIIDIFDFPIRASFPYGTSYLAPIALIVLLGCLYASFRINGDLDLLPLITFVFVVTIWGNIEWFYSDAEGINLTLIVQLFWFFVAFYVAYTFRVLFSEKFNFEKMLFLSLAAVSIIHLLLLISLKYNAGGTFLNVSEVVQRNEISFMACSVIYFVLFRYKYLSLFNNKYYRYFFVGVMFLQMILNHSRGALVIGFLILMVHLFEKNSDSYRAVKGLIWLCIAGLFLGTMFGYEVAADFRLISEVSKGGYYYEDSGIIADSFRSAIYRFSANKFLLEELVRSFIFGVGSSSAESVKVGGYMSHSFYVLVLASYGLIGFVSFLVSFLIVAIKGHQINDTSLMGAGLLTVGILSFSNDLYAWIGMIWGVMAICQNSSERIHWRGCEPTERRSFSRG